MENIVDKSVMVELLWKNTLVFAALKDQFVKSDFYKPNSKSVYQLNLKKKAFVLCKNIWGNKLSLPSFINDGNDVVMKQSFPPNFKACFVICSFAILHRLA